MARVECEDDADVQEVKDEVTNRVDAITTFPRDAERPTVTEVKIRGDVLGIALWGELTEHQLKELAEEVKDELIALDDVSQVTVSGTRDYEISVEIGEDTLREYGLSFADIEQALARNSLNVPGGLIRTEAEQIRLRTMGRRYNAAEYERIPVITRPDGTIIRLGDIASVRDAFDEDVSVAAFFNGYPAVSIDVFKTEDEDAIRISRAVERYLAAKRAELPPTVNLTKWRDNSRFVQQRLNMLLRNGKIGLVLVFLALWLFLDLRLSFWVALGIPISLAGGLALMAATGETLNMLSLFGLIMVLGLIVDDAIVVGESIYVRRRSTDDSIKAAVDGTAEVAWPVIAAVTTTVVAFLPLFFVSGVMGKFIRHIPIPVVAALLVSLFECLLILPVHLRHLPDLRQRPAAGIMRWPRLIRRRISNGLEWFIEEVYGRCIDIVLRWRYVGLAAAVPILLLTVGMIKGGVVKFVFFPEVDNDFLFARVELAAGTPLDETKRVARQVLAGWDKVVADTEVPPGQTLTEAQYTLFGSSLGFDVGPVGDNQFEVYIELLPSEVRGIHYRELVQKWEEAAGPIANAVATEFASTERGPGGKPLEIMLLSSNDSALRKAAAELQDKLESLEGVFDIQQDYRPGKREYRVHLKPEAHALGLRVADVANVLREGYYGAEAVRLQRGRDDVKVKIRYPLKGGRDTVEYFHDIRIPLPSGEKVPLRSIAEVEEAEGYSTIRRQDRRRIITVSADVQSRGANAQDIIIDLETSYLPELAAKYPSVTYSTEGQAEQRRESLSSLRIGFPLAMIGIYLIIATIFRSYLQPMLIMVTIPFGLIGAVGGHLLLHRPLTMMSFFGMVALAGIVVNDAIVLIEAVNVRLAAGLPLFEALREGGKRRFRAIFLTTLTTVAGLSPIILERSMQAQFLIPMAVSIAFGVLFATVITLIIIPCLMAAVNDLRRIVHWLWYLEWPARKEVEPGAKR